MSENKVSDHVKYYTLQEKKRGKIMADKLENQKKRFADYQFKEIKQGKFLVFEKEKFTQEDEDNGMSYRVDFYVGNTCCNFFSNSSHLDESINEIFEKFGGKKN